MLAPPFSKKPVNFDVVHLNDALLPVIRNTLSWLVPVAHTFELLDVKKSVADAVDDPIALVTNRATREIPSVLSL